MPRVKQILKKVRKIELRTQQLVHGLLQGAYTSVFKGRGIEFSEVREYRPGDDIRVIDWNVTARMNMPYVKEFIEERDLTVYFAFDVSSSNEFGSSVEKKEKAIELTASLMFAALKNNDNVGLALITDKVELYRPPRKGRRHILQLIRDLAYFRPKHKVTNLSKPLQSLSRIAKKRGIIFVVSDFLSPDFSSSLQALRQKHQVIAINMFDSREEALPDIGYVRVEDEETGEQILIDTSDPEIRETYAQLSQSRFSQLTTLFQQLQVGCIHLNNEADFYLPLKEFFARRMRA